MKREVSPFLAREAAVAALVLVALASCFAAQKHPPAKLLDLNTATAVELAQLPGIGPSTAQAIVQFREKGGPFQRVEDLLAIHGISKARLEKLRPYVILKSETKRGP
jgi:competence ComEA-like helix-hairpin-helix protein